MKLEKVQCQKKKKPSPVTCPEGGGGEEKRATEGGTKLAVAGKNLAKGIPTGKDRKHHKKGGGVKDDALF